MKNNIVAFTLEALFVGSLAAWLLLDLDGAGNLFKFMAWLMIVFGLICALSDAGKVALRKSKMAPARAAWLFVRNLAVLAITAWLGLYFLATMWAFSWLLVHSVRNAKVQS
jgi:hypothetical protein